MDKVNVLADLRSKIDHIDLELLRLFATRMETVLEIAEYKRANKLDILDSAREQKVLAKTEIIEEQNLRRYAVDFLQTLMNLSKEYQQEHLPREQWTVEMLKWEK